MIILLRKIKIISLWPHTKALKAFDKRNTFYPYLTKIFFAI
jgi:hypothetical protein